MEDKYYAEFFIAKHTQDGHPNSYIADELLKLWSNNRLTLPSKLSAGRYCILNGFYVSLIEALRKDLLQNLPLSWPLVFELLTNLNKTILDACLVGAAQDHLLLPLTLAALQKNNSDPRWKKILGEELLEENKRRMNLREKLLSELKIYDNENMIKAAQGLTEKLCLRFPDDTFIQGLTKKYEEWEANKKIADLRIKYPRVKFPKEAHADQTEVGEKAKWNDLKKTLNKEAKKLDLNGTYELAVGLFQMGLLSMSLEFLRKHKSKWQQRELLFEIEILISLRNYAEALHKAQVLIKANPDNASLLQAGLYFSAHCYYGLKDKDQALSILKGLKAHDADFRDISQLIVIWERDL